MGTKRFFKNYLVSCTLLGLVRNIIDDLRQIKKSCVNRYCVCRFLKPRHAYRTFKFYGMLFCCSVFIIGVCGEYLNFFINKNYETHPQSIVTPLIYMDWHLNWNNLAVDLRIYRLESTSWMQWADSADTAMCIQSLFKNGLIVGIFGAVFTVAIAILGWVAMPNIIANVSKKVFGTYLSY